MNRGAYLIDIATRSFFVWLVLDLILRRGWLALLLTAVINVVYELTVGRKYWRQFRAAPRRPRRKLREILQLWWRRVFARERTKSLVGAGLVILLMSYVVKLQVYYIVCACVVFTLAAISRFAPPVKSATIPCEPKCDQTSGETNCQPSATK